MQNYKIEKGVKLTAPSRPVASEQVSRAVATMLMLAKGESFLIKDALEAIRGVKRMCDFNARQRANASGRVYAARKTGAGVRIWRVK